MLPPTKKSFLDLPHPIRRRIYIEAGLPTNYRINLSCSNPCLRFSAFSFPISRFYHGRFDGNDEFFGDKMTLMTSSLLRVSRAVSKEVFFIIYSENDFAISRALAWGLRPADYLRAEALGAMTSLGIHLNMCTSDVAGGCSGKLFLVGETEPDAPPLSNRNAQNVEVINEWKRLANRMSTSVNSSLRLEFICDVEDLETAQEIVKPLHQLPVLNDLSIRISKRPTRALQILAQTTRLQVMGRINRGSSLPTFRHYDSLPKELRLLILEQTSLICPMEIQWRSECNMFLPKHDSKCGLTRDICVCSVEHGAASSRCQCYQKPFSIFHVSHRMRLEAQEVFYSKNHFVIGPHFGSRIFDSRTPDELEILLFLLMIPEDAIHHLRSLEIVFPLYPRNFLRREGKAHNSWLKAIDIITREIDVSRLTLNICFIPLPHHGLFDRSDKLVADICQWFLEPLAQLKGLKDLFVNLGSRIDTKYEDIRVRKERELEEMIMGIGYDSSGRGKHEMWSRWDWDVWNNPEFQTQEEARQRARLVG
ncbi:hypothetical protein G7Y89_g4036 [Cudoniella acicularis]|uniref:F-box domain-containing protein n=1 Tax=Cudoniella acicularis TaxID=354080 RepID=A0A8H4W7U3_9HELO|nr:hypothetical protein G7Y89_g4036 [Cudoniella acicularis]